MQSIIYLATDHAGLTLKDTVKEWLIGQGYNIKDCGAMTEDLTDDFPDYIKLAAEAVSKNPATSRAVIFGGSGQGEAMVANRFPQVRATVYYGSSEEIVKLSREHNDANVLSIGARFVSLEETKHALTTWLNTEPLTDEKYQRRNQKIERITKNIS